MNKEIFVRQNHKNIKKLQSEDFLDRIDTIEELRDYINEDEVSSLIINSFMDKNYLVRCEAYDAFHESANCMVFSILLKRISREKSICARMHLISTLCGIAKKIGYSKTEKEYIIKFYQREIADSVIIAYECLLYIEDKNINHIYKALSFLDSKKYRIRCNVINLLSDVVDKENISIIKQKYIEKVKSENSYAVKSLLENELQAL